LSAKSLSAFLQRLDASADGDPIDALRLLLEWLRPPTGGGIAGVLERIERLALALEADPDLRRRLCATLGTGIATWHHLAVYTEIGLQSRRGFLRELFHRAYERVNPRPSDRGDLKDVLALVFPYPDDPRWVGALPEDAWLRLFDALACAGGDYPDAARRTRDGVLYALEMLGLWIAAEELDPELRRLDPRAAEHDSAFLGLQRELASFVTDYAHWDDEGTGQYHDDAHARVLLEQCAQQVEQLRKRAVTRGSSISLTYLLERLDQTLTRIAALLDTLDPASPDRRRAAAVRLFKELVVGNAARHGLAPLWRENTRLLARSVTEHASRTGEHYITHDLAEYLQMLRAGAGAGLVIAVMAFVKIQVIALGLGPGHEAFWVSLNYGLGFVLIHVLHFTVATKQPAMTAALLAAAIEKSDRGTADRRKLAELLVQVGRSQFAAVLGNVGIALPMAFALGGFWRAGLGAPLLDADAMAYQIDGLRPFAGLALLYAAIAGVWLFVSGLIAGAFDNRAARLELGARLRHHPLLSRVLSERWRERLGAYMDGNYGALAGNFVFGVLLGTTAYLGHLTGLPMDIRHVAFSSANLGFVAASEEAWRLALVGYLGYVLLIGVVNLWVSFGLALWVALKARGTRLGSLALLLQAYFAEARRRPRDLLWPPSDARDGGASDNARTG
jgi:site-specific recombinase